MKTISIGKSSLTSSRLAYGCWRIAETEDAAKTTGRAAVLAAYEAGYTLFDLADIYCDGRSESALGRVLKEVTGMRERILIATKCGIRKSGEPTPDAPVRYDFSVQHILWSCEHSLRRLGIQTIDLYQLHRPDWLCDPMEVAEAFTILKKGGKVREFGVSNFTPSQINMLQKSCPMPLIVNQVEISLSQLDCFTNGTLDQCMAEKMTPLAWSPLGGGLLADGATSLLPAQEKYRPASIVAAVDSLAKARGVSRSAIALAWLMTHPSKIVPIVGSTKPERIKDAVKSTTVELTREEWYTLLEAARDERLP